MSRAAEEIPMLKSVAVAAEPESEPALARRLSTKSGACAEIVDRDGAEVVAIRDPRGRVLFEYDATTGSGALTMPEGDLSLHAPQGAIDLVAQKGVRCVSHGEISLQSRTAASLGVVGSAGKLRATRSGVTVAGERVDVTAAASELKLGRTTYVGERLDATLGAAQLMVEKLETNAERIITRAHDIFQKVRGLHQLKTNRVRTLVEDTVELKARDVTMKAGEDMNIDGERINLG
jgi:hypothetical protein